MRCLVHGAMCQLHTCVPHCRELRWDIERCTGVVCWTASSHVTDDRKAERYKTKEKGWCSRKYNVSAMRDEPCAVVRWVTDLGRGMKHILVVTPCQLSFISRFLMSRPSQLTVANAVADRQSKAIAGPVFRPLRPSRGEVKDCPETGTPHTAPLFERRGMATANCGGRSSGLGLGVLCIFRHAVGFTYPMSNTGRRLDLLCRLLRPAGTGQTANHTGGLHLVRVALLSLVAWRPVQGDAGLPAKESVSSRSEAGPESLATVGMTCVWPSRCKQAIRVLRQYQSI